MIDFSCMLLRVMSSGMFLFNACSRATRDTTDILLGISRFVSMCAVFFPCGVAGLLLLLFSAVIVFYP